LARPLHIPLVSLLALVAASAPGCASKCGSNCPNTEIGVLASSGENLNWTGSVDGGPGTNWTGPACPPYPPSCRGDDNNPCQIFTIVGSGPGTCDLTITFSDRPTFVVHAEFGPATTQGCCKGFPVIGSAVVMVPPLGSPPQDAGAPPAGDAAAATDASDAAAATDASDAAAATDAGDTAATDADDAASADAAAIF
jgi:hypothetical protein